jgi:rhodanese-related sulfurtransferase
VVLVCRSGKRAEQARRKLAAAGCGNLAVLEGGVTAWEQAGLPVKRGKAVLSLERQVRIAAGLLVLAGVVLGFLVHPGFFGLSAFVGAGLTFAGLTDWCGMAQLLAKMPWNQRAAT